MRAYLQLLRLPNVFTAMADIFLGYLFTHQHLDPVLPFVLLLGASSSLYLAGMVLNDYFDLEQDARERPFRPLPSGRFSVATARILGWGLLAVGIAIGWAVAALNEDARPGIVATLLAAAVVGYDAILKRTWLGPITMGTCRTLNVLLGMSVLQGPWLPVHWVVAAGVGVYITGVTIFARTEARESARPQLALGVVVLLSGILLLASIPWWATGREWPEIDTPNRWFLFWALIAMMIGVRTTRAVVDPKPALVQVAVKSCIFSLVILDAGACLAVQSVWWGVAIWLLLLPAMLLGRWIYST